MVSSVCCSLSSSSHTASPLNSVGTFSKAYYLYKNTQSSWIRLSCHSARHSRLTFACHCQTYNAQCTIAYLRWHRYLPVSIDWYFTFVVCKWSDIAYCDPLFLPKRRSLLQLISFGQTSLPHWIHASPVFNEKTIEIPFWAIIDWNGLFYFYYSLSYPKSYRSCCCWL